MTREARFCEPRKSIWDTKRGSPGRKVMQVTVPFSGLNVCNRAIGNAEVLERREPGGK